ncbi:MAG: tyrosine-type recombinase/integrase [Pseudomonadota bacterium]
MKGCRPLSREEVRATLDAFRGRHAVRNRCMFILGVTAGFRISELLSLRLRDVIIGDDVRKDIRVARSAMKGKREGRTSLLAPIARNAIIEQVKSLQENGWPNLDTYLFKSDGVANRPIRRETAWEILQTAFKEVGVYEHVGCHAMRKTYANETYNYMLGCVADGQALDPFIETVKALGHADPKSTMAYLGFREEHVHNAVLHIGSLYE